MPRQVSPPCPRRHARHRGFSLIELLIVVAIIGIIAAIAIPNLLASRRAANESAAIFSVRTLSTAEQVFRTTHGGGTAFATMAQLLATEMVDSNLGSATNAANAKSGYFYGVTLSAAASAFCVGAAPVSASSGTRNFSSDTPGIIFQHPLAVAAPPASVAGGVPLRN